MDRDRGMAPQLKRAEKQPEVGASRVQASLHSHGLGELRLLWWNDSLGAVVLLMPKGSCLLGLSKPVPASRRAVPVLVPCQCVIILLPSVCFVS